MRFLLNFLGRNWVFLSLLQNNKGLELLYQIKRPPLLLQLVFWRRPERHHRRRLRGSSSSRRGRGSRWNSTAFTVLKILFPVDFWFYWISEIENFIYSSSSHDYCHVWCKFWCLIYIIYGFWYNLSFFFHSSVLHQSRTPCRCTPRISWCHHLHTYRIKFCSY